MRVLGELRLAKSAARKESSFGGGDEDPSFCSQTSTSGDCDAHRTWEPPAPSNQDSSFGAGARPGPPRDSPTRKGEERRGREGTAARTQSDVCMVIQGVKGVSATAAASPPYSPLSGPLDPVLSCLLRLCSNKPYPNNAAS